MEFEKYSTEALDLVYKEAEKIDNAIQDAFRNVNNKSYILLASLLTIIGWSINLLSADFWPATLNIVLLIYPVYVLQKNLRPRVWWYPGAEPKLLMHEWFGNQKKQEQHRHLLIQRIEDLQQAIDQNGQELYQSHKRLKKALISFGIILILFLVFRVLGLG